ncbi:cation-binding protein [Amycolatopsis antarctica]|uniref:Cation-binding protein n=1 Tax=Amycolatopsis antarctica TaxID=1854586 RepID=A0A263D5B6_9PSEU|nr:hemerythrin domain-containing protein [Amycolatopsis antarctica]OZM72666.1 cation-binding protein [Amycolatopsis antarctica]
MTNDVVELILADHRKFEELARGLRDIDADRSALRAEMAALLIAHAEAEEHEVYPKLASRNATEDDEVEHGEEEHAEINKALLEFMEIEDLKGEDYDEALEGLVEVLNHHLNEEEQSVLNDARRNLDANTRERLGVAFTTARKVQLDTNCGRIENVRLIVEKTRDRID